MLSSSLHNISILWLLPNLSFFLQVQKNVSAFIENQENSSYTSEVRKHICKKKNPTHTPAHNPLYSERKSK